MLYDTFDPNPRAVLNPDELVEKIPDFPKTAVSCFSYFTMDRLVEALHGEKIAEVHIANMTVPIYKGHYMGLEVALFASYVGAPTCISVLEEVFAMGAEKLVLFGTCGVLDAGIGDCSVIVPTSAVREEGTSFHYAPASREIAVNTRYFRNFTSLLEEANFSYFVGKTWTTDAIYRETRGKVESMKNEGCICVDMECSAVFAFAQFRGYDVFQFFYAADNLDQEVWDERSLSNRANPLEKDRIARLACEMAKRMWEE